MKNNRKRSSGWARTKKYPHSFHPAHYRRVGKDDIEYITFTHSTEVDLGNEKIQTIPMLDNISPKERFENKKNNLKFGENRSYAFPKVYVGTRSALYKESKEFKPVEFDNKRINLMHKILPREKVFFTSNSKKNKKNQKIV